MSEDVQGPSVSGELDSDAVRVEVTALGFDGPMEVYYDEAYECVFAIWEDAGARCTLAFNSDEWDAFVAEVEKEFEKMRD